MSNELVMKADNIIKTFTSGEMTVNALKGVDVELRRGEMLSIMGSSGSGKSTMLNILGALENPDEGKIYLNGIEIQDYSIEPVATQMRNEHIGFVFQDYGLLNDLSVKENIALVLQLKGVKERLIKDKVKEVLQSVGLLEKINSRINELSGGQRQRVAIARAIIADPEIILADEPTGNLDYNTSVEIMELFVKLKKNNNQSMIVVTHDPMVAAYADRVMFLHDGSKVAEHINSDNEDNYSSIIDIFRNINTMN